MHPLAKEYIKKHPFEFLWEVIKSFMLFIAPHIYILWKYYSIVEKLNK